jgi:hypothetical protein
VQVGAEIVGGILGLEGGYKGQTINMRGISIPLPKGRLGGAGGGAFGTGLASGAVYTGREILSELVGGPELNFDKLADDLVMNSIFGGVPIGISQQAKIINKFGYAGGDNDLGLIMRTAQDADNQTARRQAKEDFGIDLTVAEIEYGKNPSRLVQLQSYLSRGKEGYKLVDYYANTSAQIDEALDTYLAELQSGKYVTGKKAASITGEGDANPVETAKNISESVIRKMAEKKEARYLKLLNQAKEETRIYYYGADGNLLDPIQQADIQDLLLGVDDATANAYMKQNGLTALQT